MMRKWAAIAWQVIKTILLGVLIGMALYYFFLQLGIAFDESTQWLDH